MFIDDGELQQPSYVDATRCSKCDGER